MDFIITLVVVNSNWHRGARGHVMCHPAKAGHPGWQYMKGWQCHHNHPAKMGWTGWQDWKQ
ncbi:hypothetical protein BM1_10692 [Bipolaris maydis]|nr:hypothetical protein BM1_10692 [Bipolaris maydis]